jgi:hypothetical protein
VFTSLAKYNRSNSKNTGTSIKRFVNPARAAEIQIPKIGDKPYELEKIQYMKDRLGVNYTKESLEYLRCITSLGNFLKLNNLSVNDKWKKAYYYLEKDYVGFLTSSKTMIIFRNIHENPKMRYVKYPVFNAIDLGEVFYTIPTSVDPMKESIDLHIAEGVMDIHGVFFHVKHADMNDAIYVAVGGSGYKRVLRYFLNKGFLTNLNIHIYSDTDKSIEWYNQLDDMRIWFNDINIYYNRYNDVFRHKKGEDEIQIKDFGVKKEFIKLERVFSK